MSSWPYMYKKRSKIKHLDFPVGMPQIMRPKVDVYVRLIPWWFHRRKCSFRWDRYSWSRRRWSSVRGGQWYCRYRPSEHRTPRSRCRRCSSKSTDRKWQGGAEVPRHRRTGSGWMVPVFLEIVGPEVVGWCRCSSKSTDRKWLDGSGVSRSRRTGSGKVAPVFLDVVGPEVAGWRDPLRSEKAYASQQTIATMLNPDAVTITTYDLYQYTQGEVTLQ